MNAMLRSTVLSLLTATALLFQPAHALDTPAKTAEKKAVRGTPQAPRQLLWDDLLPQQERDAPPPEPPGIQPLFDDESGPAARQYGSSRVSTELDGQTIKLPGFVVPIHINKQMMVSEFLLVPYYGACIHVPPPPPNQTVYVKMAQPMRLKSMYEPVWIIGTMSTKSVSSKLADAAYSIAGTKSEPYDDY